MSDSVSKVAPKSVIHKPIANIQEFKIIRKNSNLFEFNGKFQKWIFSDPLKPEKSMGGPDKDRVIFPFQGTCSEKTFKNTVTMSKNNKISQQFGATNYQDIGKWPFSENA